MKKKLLILLSILCTLLFTACGKETEHEMEVPSQGYFNANVLEIKNHTILAECIECESGAISVGNQVSISMDTISSEEIPLLVAGDTIRVVYIGEVMESDPIKLQEVISIFWIDENGEIVTEGAEITEIKHEPTETNEFIYQIENPSWEYYCSDAVVEVENISFELEKVYEVKNDITDLEVWEASNKITVPQFPYSDEYYFYTFTGNHFYEATGIIISGKNHCYNIDMNSFSMIPDKVFEANDPFTDDRGYVNFAKIKDGILYVSTGHKGYTANNPSTGYITAIDLGNGEVLWKSAPQVSNAYNFEIIGDVIICGYGFTDEDDFLYVLNRTNGQVMEQIPLKSMAEYIVAKGSTLYVRTYNRNYEFSIKRPPKIIYEGCYFDEGVAQYWGEIPLTESPMIYCEVWISNVTEETFDFLIKEVVMATDERTIVLPLSTAKIVNNGWGAIYEGEEFTLSFEFPDDPDRFPKEITVDGWEKLEGNTYMNNSIPGHESG